MGGHDALDAGDQVATGALGLEQGRRIAGEMIAYTLDAGNRLTRLVDSVSGTIRRTYDGLDRRLTEATPNGPVTYTYDAAGRRASMGPRAGDDHLWLRQRRPTDEHHAGQFGNEPGAR